MHAVVALLMGLAAGPAGAEPPWPGATGSVAPAPCPYPWLVACEPGQALSRRVPPPEGWVRVDLAPGSFGAWLRDLPLKPGKPAVLLHDGRRKGNQAAHAAVVDLDVGPADLQQCADAVLRLRAEWLWAVGRADEVAFRFTSGDLAAWSRWRDGWRPKVEDDRVSWSNRATPDVGRGAFRGYLDTVFTYAGTLSLAAETAPVPDPRSLRPGDVIVQGGSPGHAVLVVDMAGNASGDLLFLLAQGYSPAQDVHVLVNPADPAASPWYRLEDLDDPIVTPEWTFRSGSGGSPLRTWTQPPR